MVAADRARDGRRGFDVAADDDADDDRSRMRPAHRVDPVDHGKIGSEVTDTEPSSASGGGEGERTEIVPRPWRKPNEHDLRVGGHARSHEGGAEASIYRASGGVFGGDVNRAGRPGVAKSDECRHDER